MGSSKLSDSTYLQISGDDGTCGKLNGSATSESQDKRVS